MADVTQSVSIFQQIRLVAGLRWRILRNSLRKKSNLLDLLGLIFAGVIGGVLVIGLCFAFYAGGYAFLSQGNLEWIAFLFWEKKSVPASIKCKTQSDHQNAADDTSKDKAEQIEKIAFLAEAVSQDSPAKSGNQTNLLENADGLRHISHESSSSCGRSVPSWPTIERKICSSVVVLPASPEIPARNSSSEPWATSRPL